MRPQFSAWPIVRRRLVPLMLASCFVNLVVLALHQHELSVALSVLQFVVPVIAGYAARRAGGTYGNALRTAWLAVITDIFVVGIPLGAVGLLTGALPVHQLPAGVQIDATVIAGSVLIVAVLLPIIAGVIWLVWIPFTLIGAWIASEPAAPRFPEPQRPAGTGIVQFLDWIAVFVVAFGGMLQVLIRVGLNPNAVVFPGSGNGPPPLSEVVLLLGLASSGLLLWPGPRLPGRSARAVGPQMNYRRLRGSAPGCGLAAVRCDECEQLRQPALLNGGAQPCNAGLGDDTPGMPRRRVVSLGWLSAAVRARERHNPYLTRN